MCLDAQLNCQNCIDLPVKSADPISPCIVDLNIEKEYSKTPESNDEAVESLKSEGALTVSFIVQVPIIQIAFKLSKIVYLKKLQTTYYMVWILWNHFIYH